MKTRRSEGLGKLQRIYRGFFPKLVHKHFIMIRFHPWHIYTHRNFVNPISLIFIYLFLLLFPFIFLFSLLYIFFFNLFFQYFSFCFQHRLPFLYPLLSLFLLLIFPFNCGFSLISSPFLANTTIRCTSSAARQRIASTTHSSYK